MGVVTGLMFLVRRSGSEVFRGTFTGPVELGRVDSAGAEAERLDVPRPILDATRLPIAELSETAVSRKHVRIEGLPNDCVRLVNLGKAGAVRFNNRPLLPPGQTAEYPLPVELLVGRATILVDGASATPVNEHLQTLELPTPSAGSGDGLPRGALAELRAEAGQVHVRWWRNMIGVLQSAASSDDFFHKAAAAVVELVGLELGAVFLHGEKGWRPAAIRTASISAARPSTSVLARLLAEKRTFFSCGDTTMDVTASLASLEAFVASPILDRDGKVIGAIYGHRGLGSGGAPNITELEALLVETLACGVAAGLSRLEQELSSVARKVQFEQFFSAELAEELEKHPDLLAGRDAEVTVMFCDIRGFSRVTERLGPTQTMDWIGGVLSPLSDCVAGTGGVLVDYVGDELMAMWGAPTPQPDHAVRAGEAARAMLRAAPEIDAIWQQITGATTAFGIGINSGVARVGNVGSRRKFKYGPLGNCVNLASRVQGATKYLRVPAIVTGVTQRLLDGSFRVRRLCSVRVVNIEEPVELFELALDEADDATGLFAAYEEALAAFDAGRFAASVGILAELLAATPQDGPSQVLLSRAAACLIEEPANFSPVWTLPGK
jgi:adenylate cyclase